ncbi:MAG: hypothetical protein AAGG99_09990, partial [Pseudomonadota bacterium]
MKRTAQLRQIGGRKTRATFDCLFGESVLSGLRACAQVIPPTLPNIGQQRTRPFADPLRRAHSSDEQACR